MLVPGRLTVVLLIALCWVSSAAALDSDPGACQAAIASAGRILLRRSAALVAACQQAVGAGLLPAATDCIVDPATVERRNAAALIPLRRISLACTDAEVAALAPAGECRDAATVVELLACLGGSHAAEADALSAALGGARAPLSSAAQGCAQTASRQGQAYALGRLRLLQLCKGSGRRDLLAPGAACSSEPRTAHWLTILRTRATARISADCTAAALAETPFGAPCNAARTSDDLAACVLAAGDAAADGALAAEYPDVGFCGDGAAAVERRIDALLAQMTLAEKIEQMHGAGVAAPSHTAPNPRLGIPGLVMVDGPRGVGIAVGSATAFPVGMARGATWDTALEERVGETIGSEARAKGVSVLLAPTMNILRHPRWGRAQETYGEDTMHLGQMAAAFIRGVQHHIIASAKHFAGNSIEDTRFQVDVSVDERSLREIYLRHFQRVVEQAHSGSVMSAYNRLNGHYCAENPHLLHDVLKGEWRFPGFVESDWTLGTRSTLPSLSAGLDIEMPSPAFYGQPLFDAVENGAAPQAAIDAAVRRILRAQLCFRLDSDPPLPDPSQVGTPEHAALALTVAREAIVLLKNDTGTLPLDRAAVRSIAVVGPLATTLNMGDLGSSTVVVSRGVTPLDGIRAAGAGATVTSVLTASKPSDRDAIAAADVVVVVAGLTSRDEGELSVIAGDRKSLALPGDQDELIADTAALNPRTIVVLEGSGPVLMPWLDSVPAVLMAWYPGQEGGTAIGEVLFGDVTPSGKLPVSFPRAESDLPPFDNQSTAVTYGYFHGYRYLDHNGTAPLFPFGFGLSYASFEYSALSIAPTRLVPHGRVRVTADVRNAGSVAADEIAQLYVSYEGSLVERAVADLKGFARVHLAPGETKTVVFDLRASDLTFWDTAGGRWTLEPMTYDVRVGRSSHDLPLLGTLTVEP